MPFIQLQNSIINSKIISALFIFSSNFVRLYHKPHTKAFLHCPLRSRNSWPKKWIACLQRLYAMPSLIVNGIFNIGQDGFNRINSDWSASSHYCVNMGWAWLVLHRAMGEEQQIVDNSGIRQMTAAKCGQWPSLSVLNGWVNEPQCTSPIMDYQQVTCFLQKFLSFSDDYFEQITIILPKPWQKIDEKINRQQSEIRFFSILSYIHGAPTSWWYWWE